MNTRRLEGLKFVIYLKDFHEETYCYEGDIEFVNGYEDGNITITSDSISMGRNLPFEDLDTEEKISKWCDIIEHVKSHIEEKEPEIAKNLIKYKDTLGFRNELLNLMRKDAEEYGSTLEIFCYPFKLDNIVITYDKVIVNGEVTLNATDDELSMIEWNTKLYYIFKLQEKRKILSRYFDKMVVSYGYNPNEAFTMTMGDNSISKDSIYMGENRDEVGLDAFECVDTDYSLMELWVEAMEDHLMLAHMDAQFGGPSVVHED